MRTESDIERRIRALEEAYNDIDPPSSPDEDIKEVALLRAIEELEWVLGERDDDSGFTS